MKLGQNARTEAPRQCRTLGISDDNGGIRAHGFDSIARDTRVSPVPNRGGRRQSKQAALETSGVPAFGYCTTLNIFAPWNQRVIPAEPCAGKQQKVIEVFVHEGGPGMATFNPVSASLFYGAFSDIPTDLDAVSMAQPEV